MTPAPAAEEMTQRSGSDLGEVQRSAHAPERRCPRCNAVVPGAGDGLCTPCASAVSAQKKASVLRAMLECDWSRSLWDSFVDNLCRHDEQRPAAGSKAPRVVEASIEYFRLVEQSFPEICAAAQLSGEALHARIPSVVHRKHLLAYRFLSQDLDAEQLAMARDQASEQLRLAQVLEKAAGAAYEPLLLSFVHALGAGNKSIKTTRLYTGVAQSFCARVMPSKGAGLLDSIPWDTEAVEQFLRHSPGSAASLGSFLSHCRQTRGWDTRVPTRARLASLRSLPNRPRAPSGAGAGTDAAQDASNAREALRRVRKALELAAGRPVETLPLVPVIKLLSAATGLQQKQLRSAVSDGGWTQGRPVVLGPDATIPTGHPLYPYAVRWQQLLKQRGMSR